MDVLIDSSVWSVAMGRRSPDISHRRAVDGRISEGRVAMIGAIRQECLSGITDANRYSELCAFFRSFTDIPLILEDYELAASFFDRCRVKGIQGSHIDFLICAIAEREQLSIFTTDLDFNRYAKIIPVRRFVPD